MDNMNEMLLSIDESADKYFNKYKSTMEDFEKGSLLGKLGTIKSHDYVMLGKMLESFDVVKQMNEATGGTINSMGILPSIA